MDVQMTPEAWLYILGWIDAQGTPVNLPPLINELRIKIRDGRRNV